MPDIVERILDSVQDYIKRTGNQPSTIYLGWYEMHELKNSTIFEYYNLNAKEEIRFHNYNVFEVCDKAHLNITN